VTVPTTQPSCVAFGGRDLDTLLVTTARHGLPAETLAREPAAGNLFVFRTGHSGLVESRFLCDDAFARRGG
jgi:sugar lactone lactonase YvrE